MIVDQEHRLGPYQFSITLPPKRSPHFLTPYARLRPFRNMHRLYGKPLITSGTPATKPALGDVVALGAVLGVLASDT